MGGNAFPTPAKRLSTPQLDLLKAHAQDTVAPFFTRVAPLRDVRTKADHGDLDLACGWDHHLAWNWKGEDRGVMGSEGGDGLGGKIKSFSEVDARSAQPIDGETKEEKEKREMRIWCFDIAKACQAKEWVRRGSEISLAIPCTVFGDATKEHADDPTVSIRLRHKEEADQIGILSIRPPIRPCRLIRFLPTSRIILHYLSHPSSSTSMSLLFPNSSNDWSHHPSSCLFRNTRY